ncbi:MAG: hypothetical protein V7K98_02680 [Nostoc sp.]|uniref:hypothetical protein n=1 Tax=Nostoc sp. TaxID=1180 RepID=UPI002FFA63EE
MERYNLRSRNSASALPASKNARSTFRSKSKRSLSSSWCRPQLWTMKNRPELYKFV